jgi:protein-S-isoprenylcysteine O-methyltransferase Ste14
VSGRLLGSPIFWVVVINILGFTGSFLLESIPRLQKRFFKMPRILQQAFVLFVSGPPCILPFLPQPHFKSLGWIAIPIGIIFVIMAVTFEILAFREIGFIPSLVPKEKKGKVLGTGIYGLIRHPIYSGVIFLSLGLGLAFRALYALIYLLVVAVFFGLMTFIEEKGLIRDYREEYNEYRKKTRWRLIPFLF